jgi:hypothetical protein
MANYRNIYETIRNQQKSLKIIRNHKKNTNNKLKIKSLISNKFYRFFDFR